MDIEISDQRVRQEGCSLEAFQEELCSIVRESVNTAIQELRDENPGKLLWVRPQLFEVDISGIRVAHLMEETSEEVMARERKEKIAAEKAEKRLAKARNADLARAKALLEKHNVKWATTGAE